MSFSLQVSRFGAKSRKEVVQATQKAALELFKGVIENTPRDTGRAAANWQTTLSSPAAGEVPWNKDDPAGAKQKAMNEATSTTLTYNGGDVSIFLTNNVPYIRRLEYGHSKQAPDGMVRRELKRVAGKWT